MRRLFRQFSTPGGVPSHVSVPTPGSIHEGGELGYVLVHAFGAAFDNPDLIVAAVVGDGEAETAPLAGSWKGVNFLNPARDGAVLPILHLNGYKIAGPTVLGRDARRRTSQSLLEGHGYEVHVRRGRRPCRGAPGVRRGARHELRADPRDPGRGPTAGLHRHGRRWPAIVLRTPKGWTGPQGRGRRAGRGDVPRPTRCRSPTCATNPEQLADARGVDAELPARRSCSTQNGRLVAGARRARAAGRPADGREPARQRRASLASTSTCRHSDDYAIPVAAARDRAARVHPQARRRCHARHLHAQRRAGELPAVLPGRDELEPPRRRLRGREPLLRRADDPASDDHVAPDGRVMEVLSEHNCEGWLEGYLLTGRHGLFATYEAFAMVSASMTVQHAKWLEEASELPWRAPIPSLNILLTSTCWRNDHNGFSHQGPGLIDVDAVEEGDRGAHLPAARRQLPAVGGRPLLPQPELRQPDRHRQAAAAAVARHRRRRSSTAPRGASIWEWASNDEAARARRRAGVRRATSRRMEVVAAARVAAQARARSCGSAW